MVYPRRLHVPGPRPAGLLAALALVLAIETAIAWRPLDFAEAAAHNWRFSARESKRVSRGTDVLCLGSSLLKFGVLPRVIEQVTGLSAYNLAVCSGHMPSSYFLLRRVLESGATPRAIVVDCQDGPPADTQEEAEQLEALRVNLRAWPELLDTRDALDLAWTAGDARFAAQMATSWLLPSYKCRFEIRKAILAAFRGEDNPFRRALESSERNWVVNSGTQLMGDTPPRAAIDPPPADAAEGIPESSRKPPRNRLTDTYAKRFLALAKSRGIPVIWLIPPLTPRFEAEQRVCGIARYHKERAFAILSRYPNVTVVDCRDAGYPSEVFHDTVHLNRRGATTLSLDLSDVVRQVLGGGHARERWVRLPHYRDSTLTSLAEDFPTSLARVHRDRGAR